MFWSLIHWPLRAFVEAMAIGNLEFYKLNNGMNETSVIEFCAKMGLSCNHGRKFYYS